MAGHWRKDWKQTEQHTVTGVIREARTTGRAQASANRVRAAAAATSPRIGLAGKLIGYSYRARAIARQKAARVRTPD